LQKYFSALIFAVNGCLVLSSPVFGTLHGLITRDRLNATLVMDSAVTEEKILEKKEPYGSSKTILDGI